MSNPLLLFWYRLFATEPVRRPPRWRVPMSTSRKASATIFLVMRRMRVPLIVLIVIFAISTLGLTLIPGQDAEGRPWRMGFFDAFYVMSFTASTIGFGEIPYPFTYNQRMWVTISIYLTVVGWASAETMKSMTTGRSLVSSASLMAASTSSSLVTRMPRAP